MAIIQQPDAISLSGNMKKFIVSSGNQVSFQLSDGAAVLLEATYEPGTDGRVTIDVKDIIESRLAYLLSYDNFYEQPSIVKYFTAVVDGISVSFRVIRSGVAQLADTTSNWLTGNFLTWQPTNKPVTYYSPEWLTYYAQEACNIMLKATFPDNTVQNINLGACGAGKAFTCNLQYAVIAGLLGQKYPSYFDVWVETATGTRLTYVQRYLYSETKSELEQWFLFENSLGGLDTFRAYGDTDFTGNHDHKLSTADDVSSEYQIDTKRTYNKNTGYLDDYERRWLLDFFPSQKKYIYHQSAIRPIVVSESDVKYSASDLPSSYNFVYRFSADAASALLNLIRSEDQIPEVITIPNLESPDFSLPPRLSEYPRVQLHEGVILPAFDPNTGLPSVTTFGIIRDNILLLLQNITGTAHSHLNKSIIDQLTQADLEVLSKLSIVDGKLQIDADAYSTGELSAYGIGEGSGAGASYTRLDDWLQYVAGTSEGWVLSALLGKDLLDRIIALEADETTDDKNYLHNQSVAAAVWTVTHGLNKYPSVVTVDSANTEVIGGIRYIDLNTVELTFSSAFAGKAFCN